MYKTDLVFFPSFLCSAHLPRITRCKFLHPLRYLCQFMYLTTVKQILRNSFDLNYLRKMCGTWDLAPSWGDIYLRRKGDK